MMTLFIPSAYSYASKNILLKKDQISFYVFVPIFMTDKLQGCLVVWYFVYR